MSRDRHTDVETLAGDPAGWPALLRDLVRFAAEESPAEATLLEWLCEQPTATDRDEAARQLEFLTRVSVLETAGETVSPGRYGREYLDTHDEGVLYEGLVASEAFEPLVDALAVRPLTDVELMDLLAVELDAEFDSPAVVRPYRQWLQALGYLTHEDGVNELTRSGRRVADPDGLSTPGGPGDDQSETGPVGSLSETSGGDDAVGSPGSPPTGRRAGQPAEADPERTESWRTGGEDAVRDEAVAPDDAFAELRATYDDTCMLCGDRRRRAPETGLSLVYHPMPVDDEHGGPETAANALVACPNHYADLAHGLVRVDPQTLEVSHAYESDLSGRTLRTAERHELGSQYLAYHAQVVAEEF
jgi:hypothetical protein